MPNTRNIEFAGPRIGPPSHVSGSAAGYVIYEAGCHALREHLMENALRMVGVGLVLAGYVQWFLPGTPATGGSLEWGLALMACMVGAGVSVYFFASRGFRRIVHFDLAERQISLMRINAKGRSAVERKISVADIDSLFVKRAGGAQAKATLNIRVRGRSGSFAALEGDLRELEALHMRLCQDIRSARDCTPRRVKRFKSGSAIAATPRPGRRKVRANAGHLIAAE